MKYYDDAPGKRVLLLGDCACASPQIVGDSIKRIAGCPPSHKKIVWDMLVKYFIFNPLVRPSLIFDSYILYPIKKFKGWLINFSSKRLLLTQQSTQSEHQIHVGTDKTPQLENFR